ncbi:MAG: hypothetical protein M1821_005067 [Bathelium mastoideum]|nr:MAG: hypothetical protein M1821_005067 [Bathelium mastoideum]
MSRLEDIFYFDAGIASSDQLIYHEEISEDYNSMLDEGRAQNGLAMFQDAANGRHAFASERPMLSFTATADGSASGPQQIGDAENNFPYSEPPGALWPRMSDQLSNPPNLPINLPSLLELNQWETRLAHETATFQLQNNMDDTFLALAQPWVASSVNDNDFSNWLLDWRLRGETLPLSDCVGPAALEFRNWVRPKRVFRHEVQGDNYDIQGIDWTKLETTREKARRVRLTNYGDFPLTHSSDSSNEAHTFRFRCMRADQHSRLTHFQLRHLISAPSRNDIFYAAGSKVMHTNSANTETKCVMNLHDPSTISSRATPFSITSLTATPSVLLTGGYHGEYAYLPLAAAEGTLPIEGFVTNADSNITNHVQAFASRSAPLSSPLAAFSSNDHHLRILDTATNQFTATFAFPAAVNASAISPDARLRVVVGDGLTPWITDAESGKVLVDLCDMHRDHVFAAAWADDGITVATGGQDLRVVLWDARRWDRPLTVIQHTMSCPRSLAFSPVGSGRRLLAIAEAQDIVGIVDAVTWERQDLDFFGSVGGIAMGPDGEELWVANCDPVVGGLMEFERVGRPVAHDWVEDTAGDMRPARTELERRNRCREFGRTWM